MNAPQQMVVYPSALIKDQDPNVIPRSIVVCAIYLTPLTTNCSTLIVIQLNLLLLYDIKVMKNYLY